MQHIGVSRMSNLWDKFVYAILSLACSLTAIECVCGSPSHCVAPLIETRKQPHDERISNVLKVQQKARGL